MSDERSRSAGSRSSGSHVGRNQVWVPALSFPEDINEDPKEKRVIHKKPEESRFQLKRDDKEKGQAKGRYGKKAKLLDFGSQSTSFKLP